VGFLGLVETGILSSAANVVFIATCFGIGAVGLLIGGLWEFRGGELLGGTFGVGYAGFLFSTAVILKFFAGPIIAAGGVLAFDHAFAAWLIMWALFTAPRSAAGWRSPTVSPRDTWPAPSCST
jgi:succinate-acetate transporter protein